MKSMIFCIGTMVFILMGCSSTTSQVSTLKPDPDLVQYEYGWRDAGVRVLPGDPDTFRRTGGPSISELHPVGDKIYLTTSATNYFGEEVSSRVYVYSRKDHSYEMLEAPGMPASASVNVAAKDTALFVGGEGMLYKYSMQSLRWDTMKVLDTAYRDYVIGGHAFHLRDSSWTNLTLAGDSLLVSRFVRGHTFFGNMYSVPGFSEAYVYDLRSNEWSQLRSVDTVQKGMQVLGKVLGKIVARDISNEKTFTKLFEWRADLNVWSPLFSDDPNFGPSGKIYAQALAEYRGDLYLVTPGGDIYRMKGAKAPSVKMNTKIRLWNGDTLTNLVSLTNLKVLDGRLYATGSTVSVLNTESDEWMEIAPDWESGPLPKESYYSTFNQGCFSPYGGWDLAKYGDTLYFATNRGLWWVNLKTTLTCKLDNSTGDSCTKVAKMEQCIEPEEYCCQYEHGDVPWCKQSSCAAKGFRKEDNPLAP